MLASTSSALNEPTNLFRLATTSKAYATEILSSERLFEQLSFEQVLSIVACFEDLALDYLNERNHWPILDGFAISLLAQKNELVAFFVLSQEELRFELNGLDLARIGQASHATRMNILNNPELRAKLKSTHLAMLAENDIEASEFILDNPALFKVDPNDLGLFCRNHATNAQRFLSNKAFVRQCDGSTLALMAEYHQNQIEALLADPNRADQLDSAALVILGRHIENMAWKIFKDDECRRRLGNFGLARMAKHHKSLALYLLENEQVIQHFSGACFEQLGEIHQDVALLIYENHRQKMNLDEIVMLGKYHLAIAQKILENKSLRPLLTGKHLAMLGNHIPIAADILEDPQLKAKIQGNNVGLIGLHDFEIAQIIMRDKDLRASLHTLDLANLCKNFFSVTLLTLRSLLLQDKVSSDYLELSHKRMKTVVSICSFIQNSRKLAEKPLEMSAAAPTMLAMYNVTQGRPKTPPIPDTDAAFVAKFQTMHM